MAEQKAKTADRKKVQVVQEIPCTKCGKPTRIVKRVKNREMGIAGGMYRSCTVCDYAIRK